MPSQGKCAPARPVICQAHETGVEPPPGFDGTCRLRHLHHRRHSPGHDPTHAVADDSAAGTARWPAAGGTHHQAGRVYRRRPAPRDRGQGRAGESRQCSGLPARRLRTALAPWLGLVRTRCPHRSAPAAMAAEPRSSGRTRPSPGPTGSAAGPRDRCGHHPRIPASAKPWEHSGRMPRTVTVANTGERLSRIAVGDVVGLTSTATTYSHRHPDVA